MKYLRLLLFPFSLFYGLVVIIRNWCYDAGIFKSHEFAIPIISLGNLAVGGAGKSPMVEYLIRLFKDEHTLATLSRGYGRETKGYVIASAATTATQTGDEPAQFKHKFPDITVAVCEDRVNGINRLIPQHNLILMDDAYQHRAVKPGFSILLFDYNSITHPDFLLPTGNMREPLSGRWRTDLMVITKCPEKLTAEEESSLAKRVKLLDFQQLFFTSISYMPLQDMAENAWNGTLDGDTTIFLLTGIANPASLVQHLKTSATSIIHHNYPDHHQFTLKNISKLADEFFACPAQKKLIITTEKDAQRLGEQELQPLIAQLPIFVMPIGISFLNNGQQLFDKTVQNYVREHTTNNTIH